MPNIASYLSIRAAMSPAFSRYDQRWYFLMNLTDSPQIFAIQSPGAWPEMVTDYSERVTGIHPAPHGPGLLFTRDAGGSEYHQFYWLDLKTRDVTQLTDNPKVMHEFGAFAPDGKSFAYTGTARNGRDYKRAVAFGADGIGLFRTELSFGTGERDVYSVRDHADIYREALDLMRGLPLTIRVLDIGADKKVARVPWLKSLIPRWESAVFGAFLGLNSRGFVGQAMDGTLN